LANKLDIPSMRTKMDSKKLLKVILRRGIKVNIYLNKLSFKVSFEKSAPNQ